MELIFLYYCCIAQRLHPLMICTGMAMAYGCWVSFFGREREHHILVGAPDSSLGVGRHSHVQLGVRCTHLVVLCAMRRLLVDQ
jgi:hypothetical protein